MRSCWPVPSPMASSTPRVLGNAMGSGSSLEAAAVLSSKEAAEAIDEWSSYRSNNQDEAYVCMLCPEYVY